MKSKELPPPKKNHLEIQVGGREGVKITPLETMMMGGRSKKFGNPGRRGGQKLFLSMGGGGFFLWNNPIPVSMHNSPMAGPKAE